jgi:tyrosyl-tRNA synthetase
MIGDPSGRSDMRQMMTPETIQHNCDCFKKQMSRFIEFRRGQGADGQQRRLAAWPELH